MLTVAMLAAAVVSTLTIDVGWLLQHPAERYASDYLKRPVAIGSMRLHVFSGHFLMEDFSIGGLHDGDRPFLTAKRLSIALDWSTVFTQPADDHDPIRRAHRLADARREVVERPQLPEVHARSAGAGRAPEGAEPREDEVPARLARRVRLRGSLVALVGGRAATSI